MIVRSLWRATGSCSRAPRPRCPTAPRQEQPAPTPGTRCVNCPRRLPRGTSAVCCARRSPRRARCRWSRRSLPGASALIRPRRGSASGSPLRQAASASGWARWWASPAALGGTGAAIVIELGLHHVAATLIERDGGPACRRRSLLSERGGLWQLCQAWLDLINTAMVRQTRFDALHDATTEQQLFDALPELARDAMASGVATAALAAGGERVEVMLTRDQLAHAAQPLWREIARLLHELRPAGSALTLLLPQAVHGLPGLREALAQFAGCELVSLPAGFAAAATSLLELPPRGAGEPVRLLRRLPAAVQPALAAVASREIPDGPRAAGPAPSHLLLAGRTCALGAEPLVVGRAPGAAHAIRLAEGLAGVSRRHCTFLRDGAELLLLDHSRFGSFVNGERVAERARVRAGDEVRIGDPGVTLALIAVGEALVP